MSGSLVARMLHMVSLGRITLVDDTSVIQKLQVQERIGPDGTPSLTDNVLHVAHYGFASNPPPQSDAILLRLWGNRTLTLALGTNHQPSRPTGQGTGDSSLYAARGQRVWLAADALHVNGGGLPIVVENFSTCTVKGDLHVTGDVIAQSATDPISLTKHLHPLQGPGSLETGAPLPE